MRFSEAIMLGSTMMTPRAGLIYDSVFNMGCALGMGYFAGGLLDERGNPPSSTVTISNFPILGTNAEHPIYKTLRALPSIIVDIFDNHIMGDSQPHWTLEQLVDWVRGEEEKFEKLLLPAEAANTETASEVLTQDTVLA